MPAKLYATNMEITQDGDRVVLAYDEFDARTTRVYTTSESGEVYEIRRDGGPQPVCDSLFWPRPGQPVLHATTNTLLEVITREFRKMAKINKLAGFGGVS